MNLQLVFDTLQKERKVSLLTTPEQAASVRVMLSRKWRKYKEQLDKFGWLDSEQASWGLSMTAGKVMEDNQYQEFTFQLAPRSRSKVEYRILDPNTIIGDSDGNEQV